jgi:hypothetical protein
MSEELDRFLAGYSAEVQAIALKVRSLILEVFPTALEQVDMPSKIIAYGYDRTYAGLVCAIAPQRQYVNLMFSKGTQLPDPQGLLEGTGKSARHVKLKAPAEVENPEVRKLLSAALNLGGV